MDAAPHAATTGDVLTAPALAELIDGNRAGDIRRALTALIESGELPAGTRLPTIRDVASALETSVGSVADAWTDLRRLGFVDTRRRGGTTVSYRGPLDEASDVRADDRSPDRAPGRIDLSRAGADTSFLPDLAGPLAAAAATVEGSHQAVVTPALRAAILPRLPFEPGELLAAPGMPMAMHLAVSALVRPGDVVAIEDPTCVRNIGLLADAGAEIVTLVSDEEGPVPSSVAAALERRPSVIAFQPVAAVPVGSTLSPRRRDELARLLAAAAVDDDPAPWILEEDPAGPLAAVAGAPAPASLGELLPERTVRVVHLGRAYGSVLQTAIVAGGAGAVQLIADRQRRIGARPNPLLQNALAALLDDPAADRLVVSAAEAYARRNLALLGALDARGVHARGAGGFFAWVPVADERDALLVLAEHGISASPGSRSGFGGDGPHVRVATTRLPDDDLSIGAIADALAAAATRRFTAEDE